MNTTPDQILESLDDPKRLESLYRDNPSSFTDALDEAARTAPDSVVLRVWQARLHYLDPTRETRKRRMWHAIIVGLSVGLLVRVPSIWLGFDWYLPRLAPSLVIAAVAAYFWLQHRDRLHLVAGLAMIVIAALYTALLPDYTDSVSMSLIHLPILFWGVLGLVFTGRHRLAPDARIQFIRYNGELLILSALMGLGGMVFSGITVGLFKLVIENPEEWYFQNIGLMGAAAVPVAATYLYDSVFHRRTGIAPVLARVFAPLFLVMTLTYLVFAVVVGKNPFVDRDFLITVNGLLVVVLGMTLFSIAERGEDAEPGQMMDYVNAALLVVTLIIDLVALSAILFRLSSYGFTPNRVVVLGANLVIMTHLVWTCAAYFSLIREKGGANEVRQAVAGYLPVYIVWAALVVFVLPLVFGYA